MIPTREHWRIEQWAHQTGAIPAQLRRLKYDGEPAILTFVFGTDEVCAPEIYRISWEAFFAQFDLLELSIAWDEFTPQFQIVKVGKSSAVYAN